MVPGTFPEAKEQETKIALIAALSAAVIAVGAAQAFSGGDDSPAAPKPAASKIEDRTTTTEDRQAGRERRHEDGEDARLPESEREAVFERFYRGEAAGSTPGSGLGLPIAVSLARRWGGEVGLRRRGHGRRGRRAARAAPRCPATPWVCRAPSSGPAGAAPATAAGTTSK